jgi:hypothetical protein
MVAALPMALVVSAPRAVAQAWPSVPEVRPFFGAYVPAGKQHQLLDGGIALGAELALEFARGAHAVAGFTWVPTEQRGLDTGGRVEMAQFDLGAEWLSPGRRQVQRRLNPLVGAGVGIRAYRSRDTDAPSQANLGAYGALGGELGLGRVALRLEGRDYLTAFRGLDGRAATSLRTDAAIALGLAYHSR